MEIWLDDIEELEIIDQPSPAAENATPYATRLYLMFLFLWQFTFRVSDTGLNVLLKFLFMFLRLLARLLQLPSLQRFADTLPHSVNLARRVLGTYSDNFEKFVCCPSCSSLYSVKECIDKLPNGKLVSKTCTFVRFPRHPQPQHRKACGTPLLKMVKTSTGSSALYPRMLYCHKSLIESTKQLLLHPNFLINCEKWRELHVQSGCFEDIYDGQIWKEFLNYNGKPFLSAPFNLALSLNVDWFQPFKHTNYSVGAIYMAVQNLPRDQRFLSENVIFVGVIPGEPSIHINTLLDPLIDELLKLWDGVAMKLLSQNVVLVRAALICVTCDIPAARKVCGFVGHRGRKACTKCLKDFPTETFGDQPDYSGFERDTWPIRTNEEHRKYALLHHDCQTQSSQNDIVRKHGCRYSVLLRLPYFDPIHMCTIDPMHNLLLGTAKHIISIWKELKIINEKNLIEIQAKVNVFVTPDDIGRIPSKIASSFAGFTAEQWRNWTLIFSLFAVKEYIPYQHYQCWQLFVKACYAFCRRSIRVEEVNEGDRLIMEFCNKFESLYGAKYCNINIHLHTHLSSCILDFGPVYSF